VALLNSFGNEVAIFWLTGYVFFGCAVGVVEEIEAFIELNQSVKYIILDFEYVPAVDASGVHYFTNFASQCMNRHVPIKVCFSGAVRRLRSAVQNAVTSKGVEGLKLDVLLAEEAILWAEEELIAMYSTLSAKSVKSAARLGAVPQLSPAQALESFFKAVVPNQLFPDVGSIMSRLIRVVATKTMIEGEDLFVEGSPAEALIYIVHGQVVLTRAQRADEGCKLPTHHLNKDKGDVFVFEERLPVRVQQLSSGAVLGAAEYGLGLGKACWSTSCTATCNCQVLNIPFVDLSAALEEKPSCGLAVASRLAHLTSAHLVRLMRKSEPVPFSSL